MSDGKRSGPRDTNMKCVSNEKILHDGVEGWAFLEILFVSFFYASCNSENEVS